MKIAQMNVTAPAELVDLLEVRLPFFELRHPLLLLTKIMD